MARKKTTTQYFLSHGIPCRIHRDELGDLTADRYRDGKGIVPADPTDVYYDSFPISREHYEALMRELSAA